MRKILTVATCALLLVAAPSLLEQVASGRTLLLVPLVPGLYVAGVLEDGGLLKTMDSSGDLTLTAAVVMYVGSFWVWVAAVWGAAKIIGRARGVA